MDKVLENVRASRRKLVLRPREELVREMDEKVREMRELPAESFPDYALKLAEKALHDLRESVTEEELLRRVSEWAKISMSVKDRAKRHLMTEIGSFILQAGTDDSVRDGDGHDWRTLENNRLNFECSRCKIVGYSVGAGPGQVRAPYECQDYQLLTARTEAPSA